MSNPLALLIVAGDPLARAGLAALMGALPECELAGQIADSELALPSTDDILQETTILLWDMGWDDTPRELLELVVELPPVVALVSDNEQASAALAAGCRGVIQRDREKRVILAALQVVAAGLVVVTDDLLPEAIGPLNNGAPEPVDDLTAREMEVLHYVAEGLTNRAIAQQMTISEHTVKFHLNAIMSKLGAQSRTEAVVRATRLGLISL